MSAIDRCLANVAIDVGIGYSLAEPLYRKLARHVGVSQLASDFRTGLANANESPEVVRSWLRDFEPGIAFPHETKLCALAVSLQEYPGQTAQALLDALAQLQIMEMPRASAVAKLCLRHRRRHLAANTTRFVISADFECSYYPLASGISPHQVSDDLVTLEPLGHTARTRSATVTSPGIANET